ncbi:hypothetical protein ADT25_18710 [Xanthomonas oryzae]|uniref:Uncharacterized protein n=1 Tax=Xanthomonas oryzae TaxID=347 RepID=A0AAP0ZJJ3_9XANT|nr:hypothetical protein ADT25_18710 [Xanthomonas oryzae]QBG85385.1 hypothetical protein EYR27_18130 [Xanthomonas oryzae]
MRLAPAGQRTGSAQAMATISHAAVQCVHVPWRAISLYMLTHPHLPATDESIAGKCVMSLQ